MGGLTRCLRPSGAGRGGCGWLGLGADNRARLTEPISKAQLHRILGKAGRGTPACGVPHPTGSFTLTRDGDQLALDASASTDTDGAIASIDWYVQHADGTEENLTGTRATTTVPTDKQAVVTAVPTDKQTVVTAVITDNQDKETFTTQTSPTIG